ncbi:glycoside hydrolase [Corynascus novoguineensis]|uniref:alpha-1,2-Mannosidase n=1 Tax=Corynascus novoguineensis TaxID=1126955 RepID=A0AAN7CRK3_9PEZI|nr:glycoside hydrolase [Corynascus novoguineensis]
MPPLHHHLRRQLRPRSRLAALRTRHVLAGFAFCLTVLYFLIRSDESTSEMDLLERRMNSGPPSHPYTVVKSSVDWGSIEYRHPPPPQLAQLPKPPKRAGQPRVQHRFRKESLEARRTRDERRAAVLKLTQKCWDSYRKYAWKRDALLPLSKNGRDQFSGWAATLVDSLDTLWIMGLRDQFDEAVAAVAEIDFGHSSSPQVNIFETNIRYLGGLIAAYDLSGREVLLQKAIELGDLIYGGFNTENRMPVDNINLEAAINGSGLLVEPSVVSASPGTLTLELTRLSQITGNPKYYDAITGIVDLFFRGQNQTLLPGLFPMFVSMSRADVTTGRTFTLGGCADSLYEYFPKMHALLSGTDPQLAALTRGFMDAAKQHLFFRPMIPHEDDILMSGNVQVDLGGEPRLDPETEHLACFIGGTFALAGRLLASDEDVEVGAKLTRGCVYAYRSFPTGMMPERIDMIPCGSRGSEEPPCTWDEERWMEERAKRPEYKPHLPKGFTTAKDPRYILRPEAIESVFYMWRITGDAEWQEAAWDMFQAVARGTATETCNAAVLDVTVAMPQLPQEDYMESFWIAETLKYFYLVFSPPDLISLDKYVLNTEAHPFLRPVP